MLAHDYLRRHGLAITMFGLFFLFLTGQLIAGWMEYNNTQLTHHVAELSLWAYLGTGHFIEAVFENWESEFLQMGSYIFLTAYLFEQGSAESKPLSGRAPQDVEPARGKVRRDAPWPVRRGGIWLKLYENSLGLAFLVLFATSFFLHAAGGAADACREGAFHGEDCLSMWGYVGTSRFWFESFQNWQSEFLAVGAIIMLSIFLRQKGSPESKPVAAPNKQTGD